jgi:hypothetical protein
MLLVVVIVNVNVNINIVVADAYSYDIFDSVFQCYDSTNGKVRK